MSHQSHQSISVFVWLEADGWCWFVLREKYCWLVAGGWFVVREKYCWLVADKPSEQAEYSFTLYINISFLLSSFVFRFESCHQSRQSISLSLKKMNKGNNKCVMTARHNA
jgi:hypothetical protein